MEDIVRLILDNLWIVVFIIIALSQFFTYIRTDKRANKESSAPEQVSSLDELIRRIVEKESKQSATPPPLPQQTSYSQPQENTISTTAQSQSNTLPAVDALTSQHQARSHTYDPYTLEKKPTMGDVFESFPTYTALALHTTPHGSKATREHEQITKHKKDFNNKLSTIIDLKKALRHPTTIRQAIILSEILGPPRAIRSHSATVMYS